MQQYTIIQHKDLIINAESHGRGIDKICYQCHCGYTQSCVQCTERKFKQDIYKWEAIKPDDLVDAVNNLTMNDAEYYESNTATASDAQSKLASNPETVNHTINGFSNINYLVSGPSLFCPCRKIRGLRWLNWRQWHFWSPRQKKSSRMRR